MISIQSSTYFHLSDYREGLARMKRHGYDAYDFREFVSQNSPLYEMPESECLALLGKIREASEECGVIPYQAHAVWPADDTTEERRKENFTRYYVRAVVGCKALGCKNLVVHPLMPFGKGGEPDFARALSINEDFFRKLLPVAKENGVTLCLENMPFPNHALEAPASIRAFADRIGDENFAVCLDTGHAAVSKVAIGDAVSACGDKLRCLHVHDNFWALDTHLYPFQGAIDWSVFTSELRKIGYRGAISLECDLVRQSAPDEVVEALMLAAAAIAKYLEKETMKK